MTSTNDLTLTTFQYQEVFIEYGTKETPNEVFFRTQEMCESESFCFAQGARHTLLL